MKNVYYIGKFQFKSYSEYKDGLDDVKKIKYISDEVDINEPGVALRLYTLIRQKDIKFKSVIGEDYLLYLSDLVADDYKELSVSDLAKYDLPQSNKVRKYAGIACIVIAVISFLCFAGLEYMDVLKTRQLAKMKEEKDISRVAQYIADVINGNEEEESSFVTDEIYAAENEVKEQQKPEKKKEVLPEYRDLVANNPDFVGWIVIDGTRIDNPVVQSSEEDPEFYLNKDTNGNKDSNGSIFMDARNNFEKRDQNIIIYGHNMKSGLMFGDLKLYTDMDFYLSHKYIEFNTLYEKNRYEIVAVCLYEVPYQDENVFRYYDFLNAGTEEEFNQFAANITQANIIGEAVNITMDDELLTVSTCNSYTEDGRLYLVAKKV